MNSGDLLTRLAVWLALLGYAVGAALRLITRRRSGWLIRARMAWTLGCAFFIAHVIAAFGFFHHWSHTAAYLETARRTAELTGVRSGSGLFLNYLFGLAWLADVLWWWLAPASFARRSPRLVALWHGFAFFMVFNGTVVFGQGPVRWFGVAISAALAGFWLWHRKAVMIDAAR